MKDIEAKCLQTTRKIADKILMLRRANRMTQEEFAEKTGLDRRTIARAEDGKHRPSAESMELISSAFNVPVSYFFDESVYRHDLSKAVLLHEINTRLSVLSKKNLQLVKNFIGIIN